MFMQSVPVQQTSQHYLLQDIILHVHSTDNLKSVTKLSVLHVRLYKVLYFVRNASLVIILSSRSEDKGTYCRGSCLASL